MTRTEGPSEGEREGPATGVEGPLPFTPLAGVGVAGTAERGLAPPRESLSFMGGMGGWVGKEGEEGVPLATGAEGVRGRMSQGGWEEQETSAGVLEVLVVMAYEVDV